MNFIHTHIFFCNEGLQLRWLGIAWALAVDKEYYILENMCERASTDERLPGQSKKQTYELDLFHKNTTF